MADELTPERDLIEGYDFGPPYGVGEPWCEHRAFFAGIPGPYCGRPATVPIGRSAYCPDHAGAHR